MPPGMLDVSVHRSLWVVSWCQERVANFQLSHVFDRFRLISTLIRSVPMDAVFTPSNSRRAESLEGSSQSDRFPDLELPFVLGPTLSPRKPPAFLLAIRPSPGKRLKFAHNDTWGCASPRCVATIQGLSSASGKDVPTVFRIACGPFLRDRDHMPLLGDRRSYFLPENP